MKSNDNPQKLYDIYIDEDELNNFYIDDFNNDNEEDFDNEIEENNYREDFEKESNCVICFHSNGTYCSCKDIYINKLSPICWFYRDCFSMRADSDFQDDNDDFKE